MFERLLIPIEFGPCGEAAIQFAKKVAAPAAEVRLLHVVTNETTLFFADMLSLEHITKSRRKQLEDLEARYLSDAFRIETELRDGATYREILDAAEQWRPDVLVLGSHGRKWLERFLLGSVAERVLRGAELPVCIVKGDVSTEQGLRRVALATDLEDTSAEAAACFDRIVAGSGAEGRVVHAFHAEHWLAMTSVPAPFVESVYAGGGVPDAEVENRVRTRRQERSDQLDHLAEACRDKGFDVHATLLDGEPWTEIAAFAEREEIDLLIVGTHRYRAVERFILGSIAEKTLRTVHCPVLVVPHHSGGA